MADELIKYPWYKSKTKWAGVLLAIAQMLKVVPVPQVAAFAPVLDSLAAVLGAFGLRDAIGTQPNK